MRSTYKHKGRVYVTRVFKTLNGVNGFRSKHDGWRYLGEDQQGFHLTHESLSSPKGAVKLTSRHIAFAASVVKFDTPVRCSPKTADALVAAGYLRVVKGLYKLTVSGQKWLASAALPTKAPRANIDK